MIRPLGVLGAVAAFGLAFSPAAQAQPDDWGITRHPPPAHPHGPTKRPPRNRPPRNPNANPTPPPSGPAAQNADAARTALLIERYFRVLEADPRESFAFQRLLDLYRERDGTIDRLVEDLRGRVAADPRAFAPRMILGHVYRGRNELAAAEAIYAEAAALRPEDTAPQIALAHLRRPTDPVAARQLLESALDRTRIAADREALLRELGEIALDMRDVDGARVYFDRLARDAGQSVYLRTELARALATRGDHARAVEEYQRVLRALRGDARVSGPVLRDLARSQLDAGDAPAAIETLDRALRVSEPGVRREIRDVLVEAYRRDDRLPELAERLAHEGSDFETLELLARVHDELGNEGPALDAYRRALARNPRDIDARVHVVQLLSRSGRIEDVIAEYRALIRVAPREPRFVVELAQLLMQTGQREEALRLAAETARRFGSEPSVHVALAELYSRWNEDTLALREMETLARIDPHDPAHLDALGAQQLAAGQREAALATWRRILTADTDRARAHATLGAIYADHDMLADAEAAYREAVRLEPDHLDYVRGHANVLERLRRDDEAAAAWSRVLDLAAGDRAARREARQRVVAIWARSQRLGRSVADLERRFRATPPDVEAGRFLAEAYRVQRRPDEARRVLAEVIALEPGDVESLLALERARATAGDLDGAIEVLARLVEADPRRAPQYLQRMAEHALALYRDEDAVRYAARAVEHTPDDAEAHRRLGDLYRARQDTERAIASYRRAIELDERLFPTYLELAELHLARGELREADILYRRVLRASPDDDLVGRAARASIQIHIGNGTLEELEQDLLPLAIGHTQRPIYRRAVVELYDALAGPLIQRAARGGTEGREARDRLHRLGGRAIKPLLEALADDDPAQRRVAVALLGHLGNPNAAAPLLAAATHGDADLELRRRALLAAAAIAPPELAPRLAEISEGPLRPIATLALARLAAPGRREVLAALRNALAHGSPVVQAYAALGLGRARDAQSLETLRTLLHDGLDDVRAAAAWALSRSGELDDDREHALAEMLRSGRAVPARAAADALGRAGGARGRDALADALFNADASRRRAFAAGLRLAAVRPRSPAGAAADTELPMPALPPESFAEYFDLVLAAGAAPAETPVDLAPLRPALQQAIQEALAGTDPRILAALDVLSGRESGLALGPLTASLDTWPEEPRRAALAELTALGESIAPALATVAGHADPRIRAAAVHLLGLVDTPESDAAVVAALDDTDPSVRRAALAAVSPGATTVARVAALLHADRDWSLRTRAAEALGRLAAPECVPPLAEALRTDRYAFVREAAALALARIGTPEALAALREAAAHDSEPRVREAATAALH